MIINISSMTLIWVIQKKNKGITCITEYENLNELTRTTYKEQAKKNSVWTWLYWRWSLWHTWLCGSRNPNTSEYCASDFPNNCFSALNNSTVNINNSTWWCYNVEDELQVSWNLNEIKALASKHNYFLGSFCFHTENQS